MLDRLKKVDFHNAEEFYSKLYFIFNLSIAISLLPFCLLFLDVMHQSTGSTAIENPVINIAVVVLLCGLSMYLFYNGFKLLQGNQAIDLRLTMREKMKRYYELHIDRFFWYTLSTLVSIVALLLTRSFVFIVTYVIVLGAMSIFRPTLRVMIKRLRLDDEEKEVIVQNLEIKR